MKAKIVDAVLALALTALGLLLMSFDIGTTDAEVARAIADGSMVHTTDSRSVWMIPVFLGATIPVFWWRRSVLAVTGIALAVMSLHDLLFGWVTRCGAGLPLVFVLGFLGALTYDRGKAWIAVGLDVLLTVAVLVRDATTGLEPLALAVPVLLIVFGIGRAARHRTALNQELTARDADLRSLRDERAALVVAGGRARLSGQLDGLLRERLDQLTTAASSAGGLPPAQTRLLLESIETDSRRTLDDMREIVGLLRGGDVVLEPAPAMAHLDALLTSNGSHLRVLGDPRSLPATVELSAYRIVEHLVAALGLPCEVTVCFEDAALEIRVNGPLDGRADLKAAVARAKERAKLLGGSVDVKVTRGRAGAVAQLPVPVPG